MAVDKDRIAVETKAFIKSNIMNIAVAFIAVAYILYQQLIVETTQMNVWQCICSAGIAIVAGIMIKQGLGENGFTKGYGSDIWKDETEKYNIACNSAHDYMEYVDNFDSCEEIEYKQKYRINHLTAAHLKYSTFFDKDGNYIKHNIITAKKYEKMKKKHIELDENDVVLDLHQRRELKRCMRVRIYPLNIFSEYSKCVDDITRPEVTDKKQRTKMFGKNSISQIVVAIAGVYMTFLFDKWSWASFIGATIQVSCWLITGVLQLYDNYNYIVVDKVNKLREKKFKIEKFKYGCEHGLYKENPYNKYIIGETQYENEQVAVG